MSSNGGREEMFVMETNTVVEIYDTTLRDGSQGEGINFSVHDKLRIMHRLDEFGVQYIEGGWPGSNPKDIDFFKQAMKAWPKNARLAAFGSTRRKDTKVGSDEQVRLLLKAETPVITIFGKTWTFHVTEILGTTLDENLRMIADTVAYLKRNGRFVVYDAEHAFDGFKADADYALQTLRVAREAGADRIVLCDTNGGSLPLEIAQMVHAAVEKLKLQPGIHPHHDMGLGVANALAALDAGATHVQGTFNGFGERCGNCNLTTLIPIIAFKLRRLSVPAQSLPRLKELSQFVDDVANLRHDPRQPFVGDSVFAHKGGMHVNAVEKAPRSFEHMEPHLVGNRRRILVSDLSGRSNIVMKARELGFRFRSQTPELKTLLTRVKQLEHEGYEFEAAEGSLALLILRSRKQYRPKFSVVECDVTGRIQNLDVRRSICSALVELRIGSKTEHSGAKAIGLVNAIDLALHKVLDVYFAELGRVRLTDYKVRILSDAEGTQAVTRVLATFTDGTREWGTVGVSGNIADSSLEALVDGLEYALLFRK